MDGDAPTTKRYRAFFPFAGIGGGALGFAQAEAALTRAGLTGRFEVVGGLDFDEGAATDFEALTGAPCLRADVRDVTPEQLRGFCGGASPDVVFGSPPCKGASGLLGNEKAETEAYREMNRLLLVWTELMLTTWATDLPRMVIYENVPRITSRAKDALAQAIGKLQAAGYVVHAGTHNCGELGGLAQNRVRFLLVARLQRRVPNLLFTPPRQRVRGCGEVLGPLPLPGDTAGGGAMHALPDICVLNWIRLALIPPGGDWRDIEGALAEHQKRREHWSRYSVATWSCATPAVVGSGTNGAYGVADPRVAALPEGAHYFPQSYGVARWGDPTQTVTGAAKIGTGAFSVADPRVPEAYPCTYGVLGWSDPAHAVTGKASTGTGPFSVADPRLPGGPDLAVRCRVTRFDQPPPYVPLFATVSGCWHRPLTTWELLALQSFPTHVWGAPVVLSGTNITDWRERIGNAVPPAAARAVGVQFLLTLLHADAGLGFALTGAGGVWVRGRPPPAWAKELGVLPLYPERDPGAARRCGTLAPVDGAEPWGGAARGIEWRDATWSPAAGVRQ